MRNIYRHTALLIFIGLLFAITVSLVLKYDTIGTMKQNSNDDITIIVDAGHGGEDGGAVAADGTFEKDYNLDVSLKLNKILELYGFNVVMTRTEDKMTCDNGLRTQREKKISDIRNRLELINSIKNPIFVSVHQNKFNDPNQQGAQVFYSKNNINSEILADEIQNSVSSKIQTQNKRKTKPSGTEIYLLYHSSVPSVLVECGFLSNTEDLANLKNEQYRTKLAIIIADGILNYISKIR